MTKCLKRGFGIIEASPAKIENPFDISEGAFNLETPGTSPAMSTSNAIPISGWITLADVCAPRNPTSSWTVATPYI